MKELEKTTYIYSVEAIGLAKSLEKEKVNSPEVTEFKNLSGKLYTLFADSFKAEENKDFADSLREVKMTAENLKKILAGIDPEEQQLKEQKEQLNNKLKEITNKLDEILSKIIY